MRAVEFQRQKLRSENSTALILLPIVPGHFHPTRCFAVYLHHHAFRFSLPDLGLPLPACSRPLKSNLWAFLNPWEEIGGFRNMG